VLLVIMIDWRVGRSFLAERMAELTSPVEEFLGGLEARGVLRRPGAAVVLSSSPDRISPVLALLASHLHAVPEHLVLVTVVTDHVPFVPPERRAVVEDLGHGAVRVTVHAGFMERPDVPKVLARAELPFDLAAASYFVGRETFVGGKGGRMGPLPEKLFAFLSRNAKSPTSWFSLPIDRVIEVGMQLDL
jgi:KUP system potassium uptake protein